MPICATNAKKVQLPGENGSGGVRVSERATFNSPRLRLLGVPTESEHSRASEVVARDAASGRVLDAADIIGAPHWTGWHRGLRTTAEIRLQVQPSRGIGRGFLIFQGPLLLGRIDQPQIIYAGVSGIEGLDDDVLLLERLGNVLLQRGGALGLLLELGIKLFLLLGELLVLLG